MSHSPGAAEIARRPPLRSLEVTCAVARSGSLTAAAEALGMTHGAVSRHVKAVETWLNLRLFDRHGRGVRPTQEGQRFFSQVEHGFGVIDAAADRWQRRLGRDVVRLSTTPTFAKLWLLPRLHKLETIDPPVRIDIIAVQSFVDIERGEVDLAIRYTREERVPEAAGSFMQEQLYPVASPDLVRALGPDPSPEQILELPLLHDTDATKWRAWCEAVTGNQLRPRPRDRRFEDYTLCLAAAEAGLGVALGQSPLIDNAIPSMNLARIGRSSAESPLGYYHLQAPGTDRPAVGDLLERLLAEVNC